MKTLFFDCGMGAAGDMLCAALLELVPRPDAFVEKLNSLGIPKVRIKREDSVKCGIKGTHVSVEADGVHEHEHHHEHHHEHEHHHSGLHDIEHIVNELPLSDKVRCDVMSVYRIIADAESAAHGVPVTEIHFHEVGTLDAVADIVSVCVLMEELAPDEVVVSPIHVGCGNVHCAHGILPVPAPATERILRGVPTYGGEVRGELCTPTGAALLKHFASRFGAMPTMAVSAVGYGMGSKDFPAANCVRAMLGERYFESESSDSAVELSANLDDMTPEAISFAAEELLAAGALDVYTVPLGMKKGRPGVMLCVLCTPERRAETAELIFRYTTTLGVREREYKRLILSRRIENCETPLGAVRRKRAEGFGVSRVKFEYEDLAKIARERGISLDDARLACER